MEPYADYSPVEERLVDIFLADGPIHVQIRSEDDDRIGVDWGVFLPTDPEVERAEEIADVILVALEEACAR
jgi:hypothetical protein